VGERLRSLRRGTGTVGTKPERRATNASEVLEKKPQRFFNNRPGLGGDKDDCGKKREWPTFTTMCWKGKSVTLTSAEENFHIPRGQESASVGEKGEKLQNLRPVKRSRRAGEARKKALYGKGGTEGTKPRSWWGGNASGWAPA